MVAAAEVIQRVPAGATHYARVLMAPGPDMAICLRVGAPYEVHGEVYGTDCETCGATGVTLWEALDQEGGAGYSCAACMPDYDWVGPFPLPLPAGLPTHV